MEASTDVNNRSVLIQPVEVVHCPSCDVALKPYEVAKHCEEEIDELKQLQNKIMNLEAAEQQVAGTNLQNGESSDTTRKPWSVFRKVQRNRQTRLKLRSRKRPQTEQMCPVCNLSYPQDDIHRHTEQCLRQNKTTDCHVASDNFDDDSEHEADYEEYEWAGQKRIRASSLLQGGYGSLGLGTIIKQTTDDDEEDLNVDEDDTQIYGPPQYGESDVIPPTTDTNGLDPEEHSVATYMRQLIGGGGNTANDPNLTALKIERTDIQGTTEIKETIEKLIPSSRSIDNNFELSFLGKNHLQIVESLKAKLRHYENHIQSKFKCLICLDDYRNPAISVSCWHVHCEECWLRSLGARKLCPQCNLITSPKDLRRIYL